MTHTIEDIQRLVPEASNVTHGISRVHCIINGQQEYFPLSVFDLLLTTRAKLEVAREALKELSEKEDFFAQWVACEALAKIQSLT